MAKRPSSRQKAVRQKGDRARKQKRPAPRKKQRPTRQPSDVITFLGVALVRSAPRRRLETVIVNDLETAKFLDLSRDEMALAARLLAAGPRKCKGQTENGQVRCVNMGGCGHKCHLYRQSLPMPPGGPNPDDLGPNEREWVPKEDGYGYWCSCDGWDDA